MLTCCPPISMRVTFTQFTANENAKFFQPNPTYTGVELTLSFFIIGLKLGNYQMLSSGSEHIATIAVGLDISFPF